MSPRCAGKGQGFEREIAKALSLWLTAGASDAEVWRTVTSGARATSRAKQGKGSPRAQHGDLCYVGDHGGLVELFFWRYLLELKNHRSVGLLPSVFGVPGAGVAHTAWLRTTALAEQLGRQALLVVREFRRETAVIGGPRFGELLGVAPVSAFFSWVPGPACVYLLRDVVASDTGVLYGDLRNVRSAPHGTPSR